MKRFPLLLSLCAIAIAVAAFSGFTLDKSFANDPATVSMQDAQPVNDVQPQDAQPVTVDTPTPDPDPVIVATINRPIIDGDSIHPANIPNVTRPVVLNQHYHYGGKDGSDKPRGWCGDPNCQHVQTGKVTAPVLITPGG